MSLIELARTTGDKRYVDLAGYILHGERERLKLTPQQLTYMFSGRPFTERTIMEGHAVRAGYACSGATDYYMETGDAAYKIRWRPSGAIWSRARCTSPEASARARPEKHSAMLTSCQMQKRTQKSCAAIANMMWNWRMLHATGEARFTDMLERALYNSVNSGMSLEGTLYCYRNPLELTSDSAKSIRNPWYNTTCCPPNIERILASLPGYFYSTSKDGLYVHLFDNNELNWKLKMERR